MAVPPKKKTSLTGPSLVKSEKVELVKPHPPTSFTPVKSPDQKKPKAAEPRQGEGLAIRRSLCADMDAAGLASGGEIAPSGSGAGSQSVAPTLADASPRMSDKVL